MKTIVLTQSKVALVDDEDYDSLNAHIWSADKAGYGHWYAVRGGGREPRVRMHVALLGKGVDHIDGDGLNNQRSNLRLGTTAQNNMNRWKVQSRKGRPTSSQYKGVTWDRSRDLWLAAIRLQRRQIYLGRYASEEQAARAYDAAALRLFGEFATTNVDLGLLPDGDAK